MWPIFAAQGWIAVTIRRSETDQEDIGATVASAGLDRLSGQGRKGIRRLRHHERGALQAHPRGNHIGGLGLNPKEFGAHSLRPDIHDICP
jgi:hypothetical protein